jgi:hypothetical protein
LWYYYNYRVWSPQDYSNSSEVGQQLRLAHSTREQQHEDPPSAASIWYIPKEPFLEAEELVRKAIGNEQLYHAYVVASNCSITTQFRLLRPPPLPDNDIHRRFWRLQSLSGSNQTLQNSQAGGGSGDEFYVIWKSSSSHHQRPKDEEEPLPIIIGGDDTDARPQQHRKRRHPEMLVALIRHDNDNAATYDLEFVVPPLIQQQLLQEQEARQLLLGDSSAAVESADVNDYDDEVDLGTLTI